MVDLGQKRVNNRSPFFINRFYRREACKKIDFFNRNSIKKSIKIPHLD